MGIFSHSKNKAELKAVFHIGSAFVGCSIFETNKNAAPKIIFSLKELIPLTNNPDEVFSLTLKTLDALAQKVAVAGVGAPKDIHAVLTSPWYISGTRVAKISQDAPFIFTKKIADDVMGRELEAIRKEHEGKNNRPVELIGMKTLINGYSTSVPAGQKGNTLEMDIFVSLSPEQVLKQIEEIIFRHFHAKRVFFSSLIMTSYAVARDLFVQHEDFILIDITGEATDISIIKKDVLRQSDSFPMGRNFMIRGMAEELKCDVDECKSLLSLYKDGHADSATVAKIDPIVSKLRLEWLKKFQECLANLSNDVSIPAVIFMTVDPDLSEFFSDIIRNEQFNQYILTASKFQVTLLDLQALHGIAQFEDKVTRDPFLIIDSVYINRFL